MGTCSFEGIAAVKASVRIPVIANGGIATFEDIQRSMAFTGADGVMSSEAVLENPALFCNNKDAMGEHVDQNRLAHEYLDLAEMHLLDGKAVRSGKCPKCVKAHIFKMLYMGLQANIDLRDRVQSAS